MRHYSKTLFMRFCVLLLFRDCVSTGLITRNSGRWPHNWNCHFLFVYITARMLDQHLSCMMISKLFILMS